MGVTVDGEEIDVSVSNEASEARASEEPAFEEEASTDTVTEGDSEENN